MPTPSGPDVATRPNRLPGERMPRWVKMLAVVAGLAAALFAAAHVVEDGMGHLDHGDMNAAPAGHSQHQP
jgi:hypothetical protein